MIARYTRPEIGAVWTDQARMETWRRVEVAACEEMDGPTKDNLKAIRAARFTVEAVNEREKVTDHDVAAFVDVLGSSAGDAGRWIHYGLTSSDVLDTALALQLRDAGEIVVRGGRELVEVLVAQARAHVDTVCVGRTHGVHAEPTTFGIKLAGFAMEAHRNAERLAQAFDATAFGAISGAVGTYSATSPKFERKVLARLELQAEPVSTQVVPRDRHAALLQAIALAGAGLERLATEVRHLQRTEVLEATEPFRGGEQKGSSAMPHKRNPITTERITGLARVLRGYAQTAVENVALWHERDISHSGAERVILPDATILLDYMQALAIRVIRDLERRRAADGGQPRTDPRGAVLPARAARARQGGAAARRRLPDRPGVGPAGVGQRHAAARAARAPAPVGPRPRRDLRSERLHAPRRGDRRAPRRDRRAGEDVTERAPSLHGIVVADFSRVLAGPLAGMVLADLGADVIKVEHPAGDDTRGWGPPWDEDGMATYFQSVNRNKRSVALDLADDAERALAVELGRRADVIIENFRPQTMERFGLGHDELSASNAGLVSCSITGFGRRAGRRTARL